ncbi:diguanylate cyclase (GGDEF)-like protein [Actinoplanes lutulentus]|uniref:Diguanylate cyclase (GGDEF)-like protein n=1 Tax=Actinoplanes lutulentus TaxID=1287878 RepID=A0A327Z9Q4_9ACTN|nr:bifunctional diguanylate cyclase/phosphodiesterase [Actinoplanes lutulentus]MBB2949182.1 diguanylate cyclase (GGDEF)-like protein [Actinoplanes lutulentus]RAK34666.1 diguanylate cyclase (GGDEF)-like protein [Actinoplanes lutulentus]
MSAPERQRAGGLAPTIVAVAAIAGVLVWLGVRHESDVTHGYAAGPLALAAAVFASWRIARQVRLSRPVRTFWRRLEHASFCLLVASCVTLARANNDTGLSWQTAAPMLCGVLLLMLGFLGLPGPKRTGASWVRALLDGATVATASALIFWYVVLDLAPAGTSLVSRVSAAIVGVGGVLLLVVIGKAASRPETLVDPVALRVLTVVPVVAVVGNILLIAGEDWSRLALSVLALPLIGTAVCVAALVQRRALAAPPRELLTHRSLFNLLPFLAVTATAALVVTVSAQDMNSRQRTVIIGAVLITGFVVARQLLSLRENTIALRGIRQQQAELERLALSDTLTGLPNRTRFSVVLGERLGDHQAATALLIDVDDFKMINDTLGPAAGDQLLYQVAQRLRGLCQTGELPARLGGDEFAVLLPLDDPAAAEAAAGRLLAALADPFHLGDQHLLLHASAGIAIADTGETADEVLRNADIAMYAAKEAGKASWIRFEPQMRQDMVSHARVASELRNAIIRGELRLLYQPVFDLVTGRLHGAEALVRWQHPQRGFVSPAEFIPVAERSGLIVPLGAWVLREACEQLARWRAEHGAGAIEAINVNVAVRQLREAGLVDEVAAVLSETGLTPINLILEVTESSVVDGWQVRETLEQLHDMGVRLALDDFGTGQSSLSLLRAFPVDVLKLDKSFVDGIADGEDRGRLAVAGAVAQLAEHLQLKAVAEGIESQAQMDRLRALGYRYGQGFFMAKPLPADECGALMAADPVRAA